MISSGSLFCSLSYHLRGLILNREICGKFAWQTHDLCSHPSFSISTLTVNQLWTHYWALLRRKYLKMQCSWNNRYNEGHWSSFLFPFLFLFACSFLLDFRFFWLFLGGCWEGFWGFFLSLFFGGFLWFCFVFWKFVFFFVFYCFYFPSLRCHEQTVLWKISSVCL